MKTVCDQTQLFTEVHVCVALSERNKKTVQGAGKTVEQLRRCMGGIDGLTIRWITRVIRMTLAE